MGVHALILLCRAEQLDRSFNTPSHRQVNESSLRVWKGDSDCSTFLQRLTVTQLRYMCVHVCTEDAIIYRTIVTNAIELAGVQLPLLLRVIIKKRRGYWICPYSVLNVWITWNANYLTTISKYVIIYKHHWTSTLHEGRYGDYRNSKHMTLYIHSTHSIGVSGHYSPVYT